MRWLLYGNLSPAAGDALRRHGHEASLPADVGLAPDAGLSEILEAARKSQLEILTADALMAQAPFEESRRFGRTVVHLNVEGGDIEQDDAIDRLFSRYKRLSPGRLYTVTNSRVKIRQLPGSQY
jgi:predicted nuclease of predicted toxin-antitoxin system